MPSRKNPTELATAILATPPVPTLELNRLVPPALDRIIRRCLAKDPDERWQTMLDVREELKCVLATYHLFGNPALELR
jgi:serine/threonine protein kinase